MIDRSTRFALLRAFLVVVIGQATSRGEDFPACVQPLDPARLEKTLIYEDRFESDASLKNWTVEGPGEVRWEKGKLVLVNDASDALVQAWEANGRANLNVQTYYQIIEAAVRQKRPDLIGQLNGGNASFAGGHISVWNNQLVTPKDFYLEYEFRPRSPIGLAIVHFSATGLHGEDVLDSKLPARHGVFDRYTRGEIKAYHVSYWANGPTDGKRGTSNLRKNPGFFNIASGPDLASLQLDSDPKASQIRPIKIGLLKKGNRIRFYADDQYVLGVDDQRVQDIHDATGRTVVKQNVDTGEPLGGGRVALRQMVGQTGEYTNFRVYELKH